MKARPVTRPRETVEQYLQRTGKKITVLPPSGHPDIVKLNLQRWQARTKRTWGGTGGYSL